MNLKSKLMLILALTSTIFSSCVLLLISYQLWESFERLERANVKDKIGIVHDSLNNLENQLFIKQSDWARWDDSYNFMLDKNQDYIVSNLNPGSLSNLKVELMIFVDTNRQIFKQIAIDLDKKVEIPVPSEMLRLVKPESPLLNFSNGEEKKSGIVMLSNGPFIVVSQPILNSSSEGPSHGFLVWGFHLNQAVIKSLNDLTHLNFRITGEAKPKIGAERYEIITEELLLAYTEIKDIYGNFAFNIRIELPREIHKQGLIAIRSAGSGLLLGTLFTLIALFFLIQKLILNRLLEIDTALNKIASSSDYQGSVPSTSNDEIGNLAFNLNKVLSLLRYQVEDALAANQRTYEHQHQLQLVVDNALDAIVTISESGEIIEWNPQAEVIFGKKKEDVLCRDFANLVLPEKYRTIYRILVKKFLKSGHRSTLNKKFEFTALSSNGSEIPIELAIVPIQIGNHYIFSCFIRDLRRQRELEQEQKEVKEQLIQSQKLESIGQMAGGIAHDFNNILNGVLGHAMLVKKRIPQDDKLSRHLETIIKSCEKGAKLTKDILGFARKGQYELKVLNLNESIAEAINLFSTATNHNVRIETNLDPQLWSVEADSTQILQVFLNLAVNARDAMPQGGLVSIETSNCLLEESEITLLPAGRYVKVSFKDSGTGIPVEIRDRIFDPFFTTKSLGKGTGLGLAMIFGIMKNHGGAIILDTNSSSGALFHLYFPSPEQLESLEISHDFTESNLSKISQADLRGKSVLIVDDELATTSFLTEVFQDNGMETIVANSGEEALGLINSQARFDIAVFDVMMPGMSGTDLYRHLRESRLKMPIIFASGYAENSEIIEIRKADLYVSFLQKPVQIEALLLTVCQQLSPK